MNTIRNVIKTFLIWVWIAIKWIAKQAWNGCKWLYVKTRGGILWLVGGLAAAYAITWKKTKEDVDVFDEQLYRRVDETVKKAKQTSENANKAAKHADKIIKEVEERQKKRKKLLLPILLMVVLVFMPLTGGASASANWSQDLQIAYLEQVLIAEEWRQAYVEAAEENNALKAEVQALQARLIEQDKVLAKANNDAAMLKEALVESESDNDILIAEIRSLQSHIQMQDESVTQLTLLVESLQEVIENLRAWVGQLYETINKLSRRNIQFTTSAIIKRDDEGIKFDGVMLGINW